MNPYVSRYITNIEDEGISALAGYVREHIRSIFPDIIEEMKWGVPFFSIYGSLCYLNVSKKGELIVAFYRGHLMSDSAGVFEGKDRKMIRHFVLDPNEEVNEKVLTAYLKEAALVDKELWESKGKKRKKRR